MRIELKPRTVKSCPISLVLATKCLQSIWPRSRSKPTLADTSTFVSLRELALQKRKQMDTASGLINRAQFSFVRI